MNFTGTWNPDQWKDKETADQFDVGRHSGAVGLANLMSPFQSQLGDVQGAVNNQRSARADLNALQSPLGRTQQVQRYGAQRQRRGYALGRQLAGQFMMNGQGDQADATALWAANNAAQDTNDYMADMESPEGLGQLARDRLDLNNPTHVMSLLQALGLLESQDAPRQQFHEQMSAQDAAQNGIGGAVGSLAGLVSMIPGAQWASMFKGLGRGGAGMAMLNSGGGPYGQV